MEYFLDAEELGQDVDDYLEENGWVPAQDPEEPVDSSVRTYLRSEGTDHSVACVYDGFALLTMEGTPSMGTLGTMEGVETLSGLEDEDDEEPVPHTKFDLDYSGAGPH